MFLPMWYQISGFETTTVPSRRRTLHLPSCAAVLILLAVPTRHEYQNALYCTAPSHCGTAPPLSHPSPSATAVDTLQYVHLLYVISELESTTLPSRLEYIYMFRPVPSSKNRLFARPVRSCQKQSPSRPVMKTKVCSPVPARAVEIVRTLCLPVPSATSVLQLHPVPKFCNFPNGC